MKKQYWQIIRGICILAVIMIHCPSAIGYGNIEYTTWIVSRQLINFPVALFVFMAGYFVNQEKANLKWSIERGGADYCYHI